MSDQSYMCTGKAGLGVALLTPEKDLQPKGSMRFLGERSEAVVPTAPSSTGGSFPL